MYNVAETIVDAEKVIQGYRNPALLVSFGKDSLAMLDMLQHLKLPVICYQTPYQRDRWNFANDTAAKYGVQLYDYPPEWVALEEGPKGELELVSAYSVGGKQIMGIKQAIAENATTGICGLHDCLRRPRGTMNIPWDLLISAQKHGDPDHFGGMVEIGCDVKQMPGSADVYFPMRNWTDGQVWNYIFAEKIAFDKARYDSSLSDVRDRSPDWIQGCFACVRKDNPESVPCPRLHGALVSNVSASMPYVQHDTKIASSQVSK